jgi:polyisoprenoid-binding protein YceI
MRERLPTAIRDDAEPRHGTTFAPPFEAERRATVDVYPQHDGGAMATTTRVGVPTWQLDPVHSSVEFSVKHMMMTTVRGRFKEISATLTGDRDHPEDAGVEVTVAAASIDTGTPDRDAHLRGGDFFDAERYPTITFRSTHIDGAPPKEEGDRFRLVGDLTIRDTTMEMILDCEYQGRGSDPWGKTRAGFSFRTELDRREWGLRWNQALETGGVLVANKVRVDGEVQFVRE